jgi:hypothetical protein
MGTYATEAHQTVKFVNCRTSFQAPSTDVAITTHNNQLYVNYTHTVELTHPCVVVKNSCSLTAPATVSDIEPITNTDAQTVIDKLWGTNDFTDTEPPAI